MKRNFFLLFVLNLWMISSSHGRSNENVLTSESEENYLKEAWNSLNDPVRIDPAYQRILSELPSSGQVTHRPWSDNYWPSYQGGIAYRWHTSGSSNRKTPFDYKPYSRRSVESMSKDQLAALSPAEKYDIYKENFDYPTVRRELKRTNRSDPKWHGLCHGWAAASINFRYEPGPIILTSPSGIKIPFGSSDIKALLSLYQGDINKSKTSFLGARCESNSSRSWWGGGSNLGTSACRDTNAGTFHIIMTNQLGLKGQPFVADLTRGLEVWNYPINSYSAKVVRVRNRASSGAAQGTVREVEISAKVQYAVENSASWSKIGTTAKTQNFHYRLELNSQGEIIGGEWLQFDRPDFIWLQMKPQFTGYYQDIENIYSMSIQ